MYATTGLETCSAMYSAASSSAEPPISPAITISSVSSSASKRSMTSMKLVPGAGARDHADVALGEERRRDDADVRLAGGQDPRAVRAHQPGPRKCLLQMVVD